MTWLWIVPMGLLVGLALGGLGGGGAILTIPALIYLLGEPPATAAAGSLVIVLATCVIGLVPHLRDARVGIRTVDADPYRLGNRGRIIPKNAASPGAKDQPFALSASLAFEQSYGMIDGDSASLAELCALLSNLADVPVNQSLAVTGSINQLGQVQAIGAVNEKIEGFFDICNARGLTGNQGVLIPAANVQHLMLRQDVVEAAAAGKFHIYAVADIDQAIALLTGLTAGEADANGEYPQGSINGLVAARVTELGKISQSYLGNKSH